MDSLSIVLISPATKVVSAVLGWRVGFPIGSYTCRVRANDTDVIQSKSVLLELTLPLPVEPSPNLVQCSASSLETSLQIRTDCLSWSEDVKRDIDINFSNTLKGVIRAECSDCNIERDNMELVVDPELLSSEEFCPPKMPL